MNNTTKNWVEEMNAKLPKLRAAFDKVANPDDWKGEIYARVIISNFDELTEIHEAVVHFTGTVPSFEYDAAAKVTVVKATGYRNGPAGP
jgi:hypothetical protein